MHTDDYAPPKPEVDPSLVASADATVAQLVARARRTATPIRVTFVQRQRQPTVQPGMLSALVAKRDHRGLLLYLLLLTVASAEPWDVRLPTAVWARALGLDSSKTSSRVAISKAFARLRDLRLVTSERSQRMTRITPLREDGSGAAYSHPGDKADRVSYFKLPHAFWTDGWYEQLSLPGVAMLLILRSLPPNARLALDYVPEWYGISRASAARGFAELRDHGLLVSHWEQKPDPQSPEGYRFDLHHNLKGAFAPPVPEKSSSKSTSTKTTASARRRARRQQTASRAKQKGGTDADG